MSQRHISIHSMICTHCGKCFYGRSIINKKKVICKVCKKHKQYHYSIVELYLFLQKLKSYESGLYQKIKMFEIAVFHTETFYNEYEDLNPIISNISNCSDSFSITIPKNKFTTYFNKFRVK